VEIGRERGWVEDDGVDIGREGGWVMEGWVEGGRVVGREGFGWSLFSLILLLLDCFTVPKSQVPPRSSSFSLFINVFIYFISYIDGDNNISKNLKIK